MIDRLVGAVRIHIYRSTHIDLLYFISVILLSETT